MLEAASTVTQKQLVYRLDVCQATDRDHMETIPTELLFVSYNLVNPLAKGIQ